jgi:hypothetical protein
MPKSNRGGKTASSLWSNSPAGRSWTPNVSAYTTTPQPVPQPAPQPVQPVQPIQQNQPSASYDAFRKMTDDQKADVIMQARHTPVPVFLAQNDLQKVLYGLKLNDKPTLVDDSVLDTMPGKDLYRTINATNDSTNRIKYTATDVANQVLKGSVTRVSDTGGSVHGRGIYFADDYHGSTMYGNSRGNVNSTAVIRVKLSPNARTVSTQKAAQGVANEVSNGTKLGKVLSKVNYQDKTAIWALAKGYDAMVASNGYHVIINRSALVASKDIKAAGSRWK